MLNNLRLTIGQNKTILLIFLFALTLRFLFLSHWLEDWDSIQFALAMENYSIFLHQPHPPGYPLYILLAKFLDIFVNNPAQSLTFLSVLLGSLAVIPIYLLSKKMLNQKVAILASLLFIAMPVSFSLSEVALTNIPGQFFLLLLIYGLFVYSKQPKKIILLSGLLGFMLGVRFTELPIIVALLSLVIFRHRNLKLAFLSGLLFMVGTLTWVIPLIIITGWEQFFISYSWITNYIIKHDSLLGQSERIERLWYLFKIGYTPYFTIISLAGIVWLWIKGLLRQFPYQFLIVWLLSYFVPLLFVYNLEVARYTLPCLPPLIILTVAFITKAVKPQIISTAMLLTLVLVSFSQGLDQVKRFQKTTPPTIAAVEYVKQNFTPENSVVLATFTYRHFQYYAPQFPLSYGERDVDNINLTNKFVILDFLGLKEKVPVLKNYTLDKKITFAEDKDIFTRVDKVTLFVLKTK